MFIVSSKSGGDARDAVALRVLLGEDRRKRRTVRRDHRSGLRARAVGEDAQHARLRRRADHRRPLLGTLAVRHRAGGADGHRRRPAARERRAHGGGLPRRRQPRAAAGPAARRRLARRPRQGVHHRDRGALRALGRAADRRVHRQAGQRARARARREPGRPRPAGGARCSSPTRTRSAPSSSAGSSPSRSPARSSRSIRSISRTSRRRRTRRRRCSPRATIPALEPEGSLDDLLAEAEPPNYIAIQAFIDPIARERAAAAGRPRRTRPAASSRTGSARGTCTRPGSCTRAARRPGCFVQVVDDTGEEIPIPGQDFGFGVSSARRPRATTARCRNAAGRSCASDWRTSNAARDDRARTHGPGHDGAPARARPRRADVRPERRGANRDSLGGAEGPAGSPARLLDDDPGGRDHRERLQASCSRSPTKATRSSTAATRTSATRSGATSRRSSRGSTSSTPASPAASGVSRSASA